MTSSVVSVSRGADLVRRDRQTLYNHRKKGKLSFVRQSDGSFGVDTAELQRVYGKLYVTEAELDDSRKIDDDKADSATITELRHQLELKEMELKHTKEKVEAWKEKAEKATDSIKLLEDQRIDKDQKNAEAEAKWKQALVARKNEVEQARREADEMRRMGEDRVASVQEESRAKIEALQSRGLIARLLNKTPAEI